jgi:hypothetical protein
MKNSTRNLLFKLLEAGQITSSNVPKSCLSDILNLKDQGFIDWEKSGRGGVYTVDDREAIKSLLKNTGYHGSTKVLTSKAKAVAFHKDAHKGKDDTLLLMLSATEEVFWYNNGLSVNLFKIVQDCGIASLLIKPGDTWHTNKPIALVENKDLLVYADQYFKNIEFNGSILYYRGWISKRTIAWLKTLKNIPVTIFPDYDLVGLKNYLILKKELPDLKLYIPNNLSDLLNRYGKPEKLDSSTDRKIIEQTQDTDVLSLYSLLLKYGVGLDQESLMLSDQI